MSIELQELSVVQRPRNPMRFFMFLRQWVKYRGVVDMLLVKEGNVIPRGFGVAYRLPDRDAALVLPVPVNCLVGWSRRGWLRLVHGPEPGAWDRLGRAERHAVEQGERAHALWQWQRLHDTASYADGWDAGCKWAASAAIDRIMRA